ncbi:MAG: hypothetical protein A4E63_00813 [Syntrophorhabdus sp. PtaU1.Bin050]|nr:MAG: hypothetical protein A4E63_00813 [Syntrophorhabdus sp. PtaU1.Bin050]
MQVSDDKKVDILINLLNERYDSAHKLRERSYKFTIWLLGIGVAFIGFVVTKPYLTLAQKIVLTIFITVVLLLAAFFLLSMEKGARKNRQVMIRTEEVLGCYKPGIFDDQDALYPADYMKQESPRVPHFSYLYLWLFVIAGCVIALLWFS